MWANQTVQLVDLWKGDLVEGNWPERQGRWNFGASNLGFCPVFPGWAVMSMCLRPGITSPLICFRCMLFRFTSDQYLKLLIGFSSTVGIGWIIGWICSNYGNNVIHLAWFTILNPTAQLWLSCEYCQRFFQKHWIQYMVYTEYLSTFFAWKKPLPHTFLQFLRT